jgi:hypothetical protein
MNSEAVSPGAMSSWARRPKPSVSKSQRTVSKLVPFCRRGLVAVVALTGLTPPMVIWKRSAMSGPPRASVPTSSPLIDWIGEKGMTVGDLGPVGAREGGGDGEGGG